MKARIRLDTYTDCNRFISKVNSVDVPVYFTNGKDYKISAKSMLGAMLATAEWDEIYCECERDIFSVISEFLAE